MRKEEEGQGAREKDDLCASITLLPPHWLYSIVGMLLSLNSSSSLLPGFPSSPSSPSSSRSLVLLTRTVSVAQAYLETLDHLPTTASLVLGMQLYCHHTWQ